jgi:tRNA A-37 threonylcarbamoyl transferase component Bud32
MADWDPRVNEIFLGALEQGANRQPYLDAICGADKDLRHAVEAMLAAHDQAGSFLAVPPIARQMEGSDAPSSTSTQATEGIGSATNERSAKAGGGGTDADTDDEALSRLAPAREAGSLGRLDYYEILEIAGRGGMGVVFKARDTKLQRIVAIKTLAPQLAAVGSARKRFVREAQAAAAVRDDHVVSIHAVHDDGAIPYLVMEFIDGTSLAERIKRDGALEAKEILRIGLQTAEGLAAAHKQGLVHRDIKPANILLENGVQRVKIADFGLARAVDAAHLTQSGVVAGTPLYMSPEQARGELADHRSDLFSLGSVLYTLCTGRPAFLAATTMAVLKRVCEETPRPIREANPDLPDWLAVIVERLLAKDPRNRFQSAAELAKVLGRHLAELQQPGVAPTSAASLTAAAPRKRRSLVVAGYLFGALVLAAGLTTAAILSSAWWKARQDERTERQPATNSTPADKDANAKGNSPPADPRVLTVSQKPESGGQFRTITEALDVVQPGMCIRVLDDAVYEEQLHINRPDQHDGVVLEAAKDKKPTVRVPKGEYPRGKRYCVGIKGVAGFTMRDFRVDSPNSKCCLLFITGRAAGVTLEKMQLSLNDDSMNCIEVLNLPLDAEDRPLVIQECTMNRGDGVSVYGATPGNSDVPLPCGRISVRNNTLIACHVPITLAGAVYHVHVVGNKFMDSDLSVVDFYDPLQGAGDLLIANNTMARNGRAFRLWDDSTKGSVGPSCKNIRFQNNLILDPLLPSDLFFFDHARGSGQFKGGDVQALLKTWYISHNWREIDATAAAREPAWIPGPNDMLKKPLRFMHPDKKGGFPPPPSNSDLAKGGAGDGVLPAYVGAVPPQGVPAWDWDKTWKALAPKE